MRALIFGIVGLFVPVVSVLAVILGRKDPSREARIGVYLGWVGIFLNVVGCCLISIMAATLLFLSPSPQEQFPTPESPLPEASPTSETAAPVIPTVMPVPLTGYLGIRCDDSTGSVMVSEVIPNSPAESAGIQKGDVILRIAGQEVSSCSDLAAVVRQRPGKDVLLTIRREGQTIILTATLGQR